MHRADYGRRLLLAIDAKGYGTKDDRRQAGLQDRLVRLLDTAAHRVGFARATWDRQGSGDGELALLPETEPEHVLVDDFVRELHNELEDLNHNLVAGAQVRLRLAIHHGFASPASNGYAGQGVVVVSRLVDSASVRQALVVQPGASLAVILSSRVFEDTIVQRHTTLSAKAFRRVVVANKDYTDDAYLYVPGFDVHALDLADVETGPRPAPPPSPEPAGGSGPVAPQPATVHTEFHGDVHAPNGVFGIAQQARHG